MNHEDLIRRGDVLDTLKKVFNHYNIAWDKYEGFGRTVPNSIKEIPTAFDMKNVIEQINRLETKAIPRYKGGTFGDYEGTDCYVKQSDVLEILKSVKNTNDI